MMVVKYEWLFYYRQPQVVKAVIYMRHAIHCHPASTKKKEHKKRIAIITNAVLSHTGSPITLSIRKAHQTMCENKKVWPFVWSNYHTKDMMSGQLYAQLRTHNNAHIIAVISILDEDYHTQLLLRW